MTKISIVTPSFNQCTFLQQTAASILSQRGDFDLEWIVIDGGSTDGSVEFLRTLNDPRLSFISEPDRGQSNAINKGLARATGQILGWLNSDDLYLPNTLETVCQTFAKNPSAQWLIGQCDIIDAAGKIIRPHITKYKNRQLAQYSRRRLLRENFISQPAVFWRAEFGRIIGRLDESLNYTMDYDLWCRMSIQSSPLPLPKVLSQFRLHTSSKSGSVNRRQFDEGYEVARRYLGRDNLSRLIHRFNVEKIVWSYRAIKLFS